MKGTGLLLGFISCLAVCVAQGQVDQKPPVKWLQVEQSMVNERPGFMLHVEVDKPDRVYREGDSMTVSVQAEKDCYLHLLYYSGTRVSCLFPNKFDTNNFVRAYSRIQVPHPKVDFKIVCRPPFGQEVLHAVATLQPTKVFDRDIRVERITFLEQNDLNQMVQRLQTQKKRDWAEARIRITTLASGGSIPPQKMGRRFAVCVGISKYSSDRIESLKVSHLDAQRMAKKLRDTCQVGDVTLLINEQATRKAIEQAIFHDLVRKSRPGDTVILFFSGHGGRTSDVNGDERDGFDEYLVPHDGELGNPQTMILDDMFARWLQELDGRKIAMILDNCYSGGSAKLVDGVSYGVKSVSSPSKGVFDFIDDEVRRAKDLGQQDTMVLAACKANQLAWEIPGASQGSVLTYYVLQALDDQRADNNQDGKISIAETYDYLKDVVAAYVRETFNADQTPVLIDNADDKIALKPDR